MQVQVECYAGYRDEETPRRLLLDGRATDVADVLDRWYGPDHRYFKVTDNAGAVYIVRHDTVTGNWELVSFVAARHEPVMSLRGRHLGTRH